MHQLPLMVFFGQYLMGQGVVSLEELDEALEYQKEHNKLLGRLAIEKGYLTEDQVEKTKAFQKILDLPFGTIALQKGFLTSDELDDLLFSQVVNTAHVGEALVELGYLTPEDLGRFLREYNLMEQKRLKNINQAIQSAKFPELIRSGIHALDKAFIRFAAEPVSIVSTGKSGKNEYTWSFLIHLELDSGKSFFVSIELTDQNAKKIAGKSKTVKIDDVDSCGPVCMGRNRMFFTIVKRYLVAQMENHGYKFSRTRLQSDGEKTFTQKDVYITLTSPAGEMGMSFFQSEREARNQSSSL